MADEVTLASTTDTEAEVRTALGEPAAPDAPAKAPLGETPDLAGIAAPTTDGTEKPKKKSSRSEKAEQRIAGLAREKMVLNAENQQLKAALAAAAQAPPPFQTAPPLTAPAAATPPPPKPVEDAFATYAEYQEALVDWKIDLRDRAAAATRAEPVDVEALVEQKIRAREDIARRQAWEQHQIKLATDYQQRVDAFRAVAADFDEVAKASEDLKFPPGSPIIDFVKHADTGVQIGYYLAKHPEVAERINGLSAGRQYGELGALGVLAERGLLDLFEGRSGTPSAPAAAASAPARQMAPPIVSQAPPPVPRVGSSVVTPTKRPDEMDQKEFNAWRLANIRAAGGRAH